MFVRLLFVFLSSLVSLPAWAAAQTPTRSATLETQARRIAKQENPYLQLIEERLVFVRDAYGMNTDQIARLRTGLTARIPDHDAHMALHELTLRRRTMALSQVIPGMEEGPVKTQLTAKYQNEIYDIHEKAPLGLAATAEAAEAMLPRDQVERGRQAIAKKYASALKGAKLNIARIDRLVLKPVEPGERLVIRQSTPDVAESPVSQQPPTEIGNPQPVQKASLFPPRDPSVKKRAAADLAAAKIPKKPATLRTLEPGAPTVQKPAVNKPRPTRSQPPKVVRKPAPPPPPAPPFGEWGQALSSAKTRFGFDAAQEKTASQVLENVRTRAQAYLNQTKGDYEKANATIDAGEKSKQLKTLNQKLDVFYDELNKRIESIASIEQRQASKKKEQASGQGKAAQSVPKTEVKNNSKADPKKEEPAKK